MGKKKVKMKKPSRDEMARIKAINDMNRKEKEHGQLVQIAKFRNDYITELVNGRYFLERSNMIANQLNSSMIYENIDGCPKTPEFMRAEYAHQKLQAIKSMRNSFFAKQELLNRFNHTPEEIADLEKDYYDGKVVREEYDEVYKRRNKTEFVNKPTKDKS